MRPPSAVRVIATLAVGGLVALTAVGCGGDRVITTGSAQIDRQFAALNALPPAGVPADAAHLQIVLTSTSDWSELRLSGATIVAQHLSSAQGTGQWSVQPFGVAMSRHQAAATTTVTDDVVFAATSGQQTFKYTLEKGYDGMVGVSVTNLNAPTPAKPQHYADHVHSTSDDTNRRSFNVSRRVVMTSRPLALPRADPRHLVLADFYPWFSSYGQKTLADTPADPRNATDLAGIESMTKQAKANGVNGFVVSWDGQQRHGSEFALAVKAAQQQHQVVTGYLETLQARKYKSPQKKELSWLEQLLRYAPSRKAPSAKAPSTRAHSSAFLTAHGVPVVFVYQMAALSPDDWKHILAKLHAAGDKVDLIGDTVDPRYLPDEWGLGNYAANAPIGTQRRFELNTGLVAKAGAVVDSKSAPKVFVGSVSPGYDDQKLRGKKNPVVPRDVGKRYDAVWAAAIAGQPDWMLVTSWNEWFEDTQIEPGVRTGSRALRQTAKLAALFARRG